MTKEEIEALASTMADIVRERVDAAVAPLADRIAILESRQPIDGGDADPETIRRMVEAAVFALPPAKDGESVDPEAVSRQVKDIVEARLAEWGQPQDGKSVTVEEMAPVVADLVAKAISAIPAPKDAVNLAGALIDRDGNLTLTLSDGTLRDLGRVVGRDGLDADMAALERRASEIIAALPKPKDGTDGVGFDDMAVEYDGERTIALKFVKGDRTKEFAFHMPVVLDRGVYKEGQSYQTGDGVTWAGSFWIAQQETMEKPDGGNGWRLAVKRGRDGKNALVVPERPKQPVRVGVPAKDD